MKSAVFLDRDGIINRKGEPYYIFRKEDFFLNDGVAEALGYFQSKGYLLIVITNQGGIAKGVFSTGEMEALHHYMRSELEKDNVFLTAVYYCPHHPDISQCECRKPGTLMFENAIRDHAIDPGSSFMIGDSETDIIPARKLGIKGVLLPENGNMTELVVKKGII